MKNFRKFDILCSNWYGTSNLFSFFVCLFLNYDGIVRILARDNTDTFSSFDSRCSRFSYWRKFFSFTLKSKKISSSRFSRIEEISIFLLSVSMMKVRRATPCLQSDVNTDTSCFLPVNGYYSRSTLYFVRYESCNTNGIIMISSSFFKVIRYLGK